MSTFLILFKQDIRTYGLLDIKLLLHSDFRYKYILVGWEEGTSFLLIAVRRTASRFYSLRNLNLLIRGYSKVFP